MGLSFSTYRYESRHRDETAPRMCTKEITDARLHYGYNRVHVMLPRECHQDNVMRVCRLNREPGLSLRLTRLRRNKAIK